MKKIVSVIISCCTLIFLGLFIFLPKDNFSYNENRYLEQFPKFTFNNIISGKYTENLNDYVSDHFPFREKLLTIKTKFNKFIGMYKQNDVYYGKDGALYQEYKKPQNSKIIVDTINEFSDTIDISVKFMLIPTAIDVYPERIDEHNMNYDEDITIDYYKENLGNKFIDVREKFDENKSNYLFYKTDHHYTTRGAYLAYLEYCKDVGIENINYEFEIVNDKFYGTLYSKVIDNSLEYDYIEKIKGDYNYRVNYVDDQNVTNSLYNYDYLDKKDKYSFFLDNNHSLITIDNLNINNNEQILIIKDSYANSFIPLIANHYSKIYVIDPRYYLGSISDYAKENEVDKVLFLYNVLTIDNDLGIFRVR